MIKVHKKNKLANLQTLTSTIEVRVRLFGTEDFVHSSDFCGSSSKPLEKLLPCVPILPRPTPAVDRSLDVRSLEEASDLDLFLVDTLGKNSLNTDKASVNNLLRSLSSHTILRTDIIFLI